MLMNFFLQSRTMTNFALLGVALVCLSPVTGEEAGCDYNMMHYEVGDKWFDGCEKCKCEESGEIKCTEDTVCCLWANGVGKTKRAYLNENFNDGCNDCVCLENGAACTKKMCLNKCPFKNWDLAPGWARKGEVQVYDEEVGCPKICDCERKKGVASLKCTDGIDGCVYL